MRSHPAQARRAAQPEPDTRRQSEAASHRPRTAPFRWRRRIGRLRQEEPTMPCSPRIRPALQSTALRFFGRSVPLLGLVPTRTLGDIARIWGAMEVQRPSPPLAIDVTFALDQQDASAMTWSSMGWLPAHLACCMGPRAWALKPAIRLRDCAAPHEGSEAARQQDRLRGPKQHRRRQRCGYQWLTPRSARPDQEIPRPREAACPTRP